MGVEPSNDITQGESYRSRYFESVVKGYAEILDRPALCAIRYDSLVPPNARLSWQDVEYRVDVLRATHAALDVLNLFPVWEQIVSGETVPMNKRARVAAACSRVYIERQLLPYLYFKKKHLRMHRQERKSAA